MLLIVLVCAVALNPTMPRLPFLCCRRSGARALCRPAAHTLVAVAVHLGGDELYMSGHVVARAADVVAGRRPHTGPRFASHGNAGGARATDVCASGWAAARPGGGGVGGVHPRRRPRQRRPFCRGRRGSGGCCHLQPRLVSHVGCILHGEGRTAEAAATCSRGA